MKRTYISELFIAQTTSAACSTESPARRPPTVAELSNEIAHVLGAPLADLLPDAADFGLGGGGIPQGEEQRCGPSLDLANGFGVESQLLGWIGLLFHGFDVVTLLGGDGMVGTRNGLLDELSQYQGIASHGLVNGQAACTWASSGEPEGS